MITGEKLPGSAPVSSGLYYCALETEATFRRPISHPGQFAESAVNALVRNGRPGGVFNEYAWGGYLLFKDPGHPVFIDGRCLATYDPSLLDEYVTIAYGRPGWQAVLERYGTRFVLWPSRSKVSPVGRLLQTGRWRIAYSDPVAILLERDDDELPPATLH